jgi:acyl carrier protein
LCLDPPEPFQEIGDVTRAEALDFIHQALEKSLDAPVTVTEETDLFAEKILDSLDTMIFFLTLSELTKVQFPEKDLEGAGLNKVATLVTHVVKG